MLYYIQYELVPGNMYILAIFWGDILIRKLLTIKNLQTSVNYKEIVSST